MKLLLKGGDVYRGGKFSRADVLIQDGKVKSVMPDAGFPEGYTVVDVKGKHVLPGLVDVHVHFREPGFSYKETIASGSMAAAAGGYTTVCTMPNLNPAPDSVEHLSTQLKLIKEQAVVNVIPYAAITRGQRGEGELSDFERLAPFVVGFSDDGRGVQSSELMEAAMRRAVRLDKPVVAHCEVDELINGGYIHDGNYARKNGHRGICSESEWVQVERDIELARATGCQYHICHVSTKESIGLVREAKARGIRVTCETAPHYILLCDRDMEDHGRFKMNPPIRSRFDRYAILAGIADGTIDMIATDHAPHSQQEKSKGLEGSAMGVVGLEAAFGVLYSNLVMSNVITLARLVELMSIAPRRVFGMHPSLLVGNDADIAVVDLEERWKVDPSKFFSKGRSTPFDGWDVQGRNIMTLVGGKVVFATDSIQNQIANV